MPLYNLNGARVKRFVCGDVQYNAAEGWYLFYEIAEPHHWIVMQDASCKEVKRWNVAFVRDIEWVDR